MVNEIVGSGDWDDTDSLVRHGSVETHFHSYGRSESKLAWLIIGHNKMTVRVVQEIDSVEYGMTDIQEYYANTGALKKPAENRKQVDS